LVHVVRSKDLIRLLESTSESKTNLFVPSQLTGLPVIFDEVFTGLHRLGRFRSGSFLSCHPDISVHAKLLTGGLVPLCLTAATNDVYDAFLSDEKSEALLHGHSYTAHPVGCAVANSALARMEESEKSGYWDVHKNLWASSWITSNSASDSSSKRRPDARPKTGTIPWKLDDDARDIDQMIESIDAVEDSTPSDQDGLKEEKKGLWSMWSPSFIDKLSRRNEVDGVIALGSVLGIYLRDPHGSGKTTQCHC
jgi:bifunctional dethiobiotin synthetase / adenosylmethionine---8-amino-7-oxononanoate aminotransferase